MKILEEIRQQYGQYDVPLFEISGTVVTLVTLISFVVVGWLPSCWLEWSSVPWSVPSRGRDTNIKAPSRLPHGWFATSF